MIQIRNSVFETNSSSAHSLVIKKEGIEITAENFDTEGYTWVNRDGELSYWRSELEFGRSPFAVLTSVGEKLAYVTAAFESERERIIAEVKRRIPSIKEVTFPKDWETKEPIYGWIDHESFSMLPFAVHKEGIDPVDVILDTRYVIVVDGDEYCVFDRMIQNGLINMDKIEKIYGHLDYYHEAHPEIYNIDNEMPEEEDTDA